MDVRSIDSFVYVSLHHPKYLPTEGLLKNFTVGCEKYTVYMCHFILKAYKTVTAFNYNVYIKYMSFNVYRYVNLN